MIASASPGLTRNSARKCSRALTGIGVGPVGLGDAVVDLRMGRLELGRSQPAADRLLVLAAGEEAVADVVIAERTFLVDLLGQVKHFLGEIVLAHLGVGDDPVAVARLEGGVELLDVFEGLRARS